MKTNTQTIYCENAEAAISPELERALKTRFTELDSNDIRALKCVGRNGTEVFSPALARTLVQLSELQPALVIILPAQAEEGGYKPYFVAMLTAAGEQAVADAIVKGGAL